MTEVQPTWRKFHAASPQFMDVGKAMHEHWYHPAAKDRYRRDFSISNIEYLIDYMWHQARGLEATISDKEAIIKAKDEELMELEKLLPPDIRKKMRKGKKRRANND